MSTGSIATTSSDEAGRREARITSIALVVTAAVFIVLRIIARKYGGMGLGFDDWMEVVSLMLLGSLLACTLLAIHYASGIHKDALSYADIVIFEKGMLAFECIYIVTIFAIKTSLLLMYNRIFPARQIRNASIILWTFSGCLTLSVVLVSIFQCNPIEKNWSPILPGHCLDSRSTLIWTALPNVLTDFAILSLPIRFVWFMEIKSNQKCILTLVFLSGVTFIIGSVYRFAILFGYNESDSTYTILKPTVWTIVECSTGIITGCFPLLVPLLQPLIKFIFSLFESKDVEEIPGYRNSCSTERVLSPSHFSFESAAKTSKKFKRGQKTFLRLNSANGKGNESKDPPEANLPFEVRVTTTVEIITSILNNDGPAKPRVLETGEMEMEERDKGGFKHDFGPKSMNGWI